MKRLFTMLTIIAALGLGAGNAMAETISFGGNGQNFVNNVFTADSGLTMTISTNPNSRPNLIQWMANGLHVHPDHFDSNSFIKFTFSEGVGIDYFGYSTSANHNAIQLSYEDGTSSSWLNLSNGPGGLMDLSQYGANIIALTIKGEERNNGNGNGHGGSAGGTSFFITGLEYTPNAVPVPAAVWILGTGLAGLAGLRRKMR